MNRSTLLIIGIVIALVVGVGAVLVILGRRPAPTPTPSPTPATQAPLKITVTPSATTLTASQSATLDIFLNTAGVKIDGFQFIANLDGPQVSVTDADAVTTGVQITAAQVSGLNPITNSVLAQGTIQVVRFAMITQNAGQPFSSTSPVKVATIAFVPGTTGTVKLEFNAQNTRANRTGSTEALISTDPVSLLVSPAIAVAATATPSAVTTQAAVPSGAIACDAACLTDNDCSIGLSCINNSCRNPSNPASLTCSAAGTTTTATTSATPRPTATPTTATTATRSATPTPRPTATPKIATIAALPSELPESGSVANTIFLIVTGLICITLAAGIMLRTP